MSAEKIHAVTRSSRDDLLLCYRTINLTKENKDERLGVFGFKQVDSRPLKRFEADTKNSHQLF